MAAIEFNTTGWDVFFHRAILQLDPQTIDINSLSTLHGYQNLFLLEEESLKSDMEFNAGTKILFAKSEELNAVQAEIRANHFELAKMRLRTRNKFRRTIVSNKNLRRQLVQDNEKWLCERF